MNPNRPIIDDVVGQVCWSAWQGYGSVLFLGFGEPRIFVADCVTQRGRPTMVQPTWSICVQYCTWRIKMCGELLAHSESKRTRIAGALDALKGQVFLGAERVRDSDILDFDLGGRIEMRRYFDEKSWPVASTAMWYVMHRDRAVTSWIADGSTTTKRVEP